MAKMIPPVVAADAPRGEKHLFSRLKEDPKTEDWIVLHSFDIKRHVTRGEGEADMVVLVPNFGVLCIEVKGCNVSRRDGVWTYSYNPPATSVVGPFRQASDASHSIRNYLAGRDQMLGRLMFWSAVLFTEIEFSEKSLEWEPWQAIGRTALRNPISSLITHVLEQAHARCRNRSPVPSWYHDGASRPTVKQTQSIAKLMRGDFEYCDAAWNGVQMTEAAIHRFTEEQFEALDHLRDNNRVLFKGPAGTGKTFLAIEAARRAVRDGQRTALLCFNRSLSEWLKASTETIAEEARQTGTTFFVGTFSSLMLEIAGGIVPADADRLFWTEALPTAAADRLLSNAPQAKTFDMLLVDEAQDLLTDPFLDVIDLLMDAGLCGARWAMFGDFERQAIYADADAISGLARLRARAGDGFSNFSVRVNCRNSARIAEAITITSGMAPGYSRVLRDEESLDVAIVFYRGAAHQDKLLSNTLDRLLEVFRPGQIVVLSSKGDAACAAASVAAARNFIGMVPFRGAAADTVRYASIHSFKGLESPAIILTDIDRLDGDMAKALLYVGMSRARVQLFVLMDEQLQPSYHALLNAGLRAAMAKAG